MMTYKEADRVYAITQKLLEMLDLAHADKMNPRIILHLLDLIEPMVDEKYAAVT